MRGIWTLCAIGALALVVASSAALAQSAIPKPAETTGAEAPAEAPKKTAKKKPGAQKCDELFEAACKDASGCSWSGGLVKADGSPPKGECVKVSKAADKGTKDSCPVMFEALCKETKGCEWAAGAPGADGKPAPGACAFSTKKKTAAAKKPVPPPAAAPAATEPPPDAFTDQQAQ